MPNSYFQFKAFRIDQQLSGMKVTTDACLFGAWVANEIAHSKKEPQRILDIGTGTGLLALMIGQKTKHSQIHAVEINKEAFNEASFNFSQSDWHDRLICTHSPIQDMERKNAFDVIVTNPPFFTDSQKGQHGRKNLALHNGSLPMQDLISSVESQLSISGQCFVLYPEREMHHLLTLASDHGLYPSKLVIVKNRALDSVFRVMVSLGRKKGTVQHQEIVIRKQNGKYTKPFWQLLSPYYLEYNNPDMK